MDANGNLLVQSEKPDLEIPLDETTECAAFHKKPSSKSHSQSSHEASAETNKLSSHSHLSEPSLKKSESEVKAKPPVPTFNEKPEATSLAKLEADSFTPIKSLNTFMFDWIIKARVTKKHGKRSWVNNRGEGTLLNIELIDF